MCPRGHVRLRKSEAKGKWELGTEEYKVIKGSLHKVVYWIITVREYKKSHFS